MPPHPIRKHGMAGLAAMLILGTVNAQTDVASWTALFNGRDLSGWDTYIGPHYSAEKKEFVGEPVGLNRDPDRVFTVVEIDGGSAIRVSGRDFGGFSTVAEYENYHLQLQFKWGTDKYAPKDKSVRDSGLLYHAVGPHAAEWFFWMRSFEFQIQERDCGDFWGLGGVSATMRTRRDVITVREGTPPEVKERAIYTYDPAGELRAFQRQNLHGGHARKWPDAENPTGTWNTLDLYCLGDTSVHVVNGVVTMVLHDLRQPDGAGGLVPLTKGKLQIQTEGAEVFYRGIKIRPITRLPAFAVRSDE